MFLLVGRVSGDWPRLSDAYLYGSGDLEVSTDFCSALSEVAVKRLSNPDPTELFPGFM